MNENIDLNSTLPIQLFLTGKRVMYLLDERLEAIELSAAKLATLQSIILADKAEPLVTVTCLAEVMNTTKSNVTAMVDRLIADGLVTRVRSEDDRRAVVIELTPLGQQRYQAGAEVVRTFHTELSEIFSVDEQRLIACFLQKLPNKS
jgi:MarR family transcriptional regulator for hemolysin